MRKSFIPGHWLISLSLLASALLATPASHAAVNDVLSNFAPPVLQFDNAPGTGNALKYTAGDQRFVVDGTPTVFDGTPFDAVPLPNLRADFRVDSNGNLVGGAPGHDVVLTGSVGGDSGELLTGEVYRFEWENNTGPGGTDRYAMELVVTGGLLADEYGGIGAPAGLVITTSENSNFNGFPVNPVNGDFDGRAKGLLFKLSVPPPLAMLGDTVWLDDNADGIQDNLNQPGGEQGIGGVTVKLLTAGPDGVFGTGDDIADQTLVTGDGTNTDYDNDGFDDPKGFYKFNGLVPDLEYKVMFNNPDPDGPDAYMFSPRQEGVDPMVDSDGPMSDVVTVPAGDFDDTIDAGLFRKGSIHVFGYLDVDGDGNFDPEDVAFPDTPGKTFELLDENGDVIETETTVNGEAWFVGLVPGTYSVRENPVPAGFTLTTLPNERTYTIISGEELVYEDGAAMLPSDDERFETNLGDDLRWGNKADLAMLGDTVWLDNNADGIQDNLNQPGGEPGIKDVTVKLLTAGPDGIFGTGDDVIEQTLVTGDGTNTDYDNDGNPDPLGFYKFNGLTPGVEYKVMFNNPDPVGPDAYMFSPRQEGVDPAVDSDGPMSDVVVLGSGEYDPTIDAGLFRKGSIHVFGYLDVDGDGNFDPEDVAFPDNPGKTFELLDENGDVIETETTVNGEAWFVGLVPGTYSVRENPIPTGFDLTTLPNERTYTITSGEELVYEDGAAMLPAGDQRTETNLGDDLRWGNTELAMLGDTVWLDNNADGIQDNLNQPGGEPGIEDVTVKLLTAGPDGVFGTGDDVIEQTLVTGDGTNTDYDNDGNPDPLGFYKFNGLTPGVEYKVMFNNPDPVGPDAYMFSPRQAGGDTTVDSDGPMSDVVVLASGEFNPTIDAGLFRKGSIHVFGYLDVDGDGNFDPEDVAFPDNPGKTFELLDENGDVIETETTVNGEAWFVGLAPGTYSVRENPIPTGFDLTTLPNERTYTITSGEELVYEDGAAMLPAGDQRTETNLGDDLRWGNTELAMLGDTVWLDNNADGIQDNLNQPGGEPGIKDVTVKLLTAGPDGVFGTGDDVIEQTLVTGDGTNTDYDNDGNPDPLGFYKFNGLTPGVEYKVMFNNPDPVGPDAYMFSPRQEGVDPAVDSDGPMSDVVVLGSGEYDPTIDAGLFRKGSIHVFGYLDVDGDGNFDPEDVAFPNNPGKTFELLDENGDVIETETTVNGEAWFVGLVPGTYSVRENPIPAGFDLTTLPNERTYTIISGEELVYEDGAAMLPAGDERFETNLGDDLRWGNTQDGGDPDIDIEKFTRVDINPIDIEKLVRVQGPPVVGDACDVLGKVVAMTFRYTPGNTVSTGQQSGKAAILFNGAVDDDGTSYVIVTDETDAAKALNGDGKRFFEGNVAFDATFVANEDVDDFGSNTVIHFFDDSDGPVLQTVQYHTSCSQPIQLGDVIGNATLIGYSGEDGAAEAPDLGPGLGDADADTPTGPAASAGDTVVFTYVVTNPVPNTELENVVVTDEVLWPMVPDPVFQPDPVLADSGFNVGDTDEDDKLDSGEVWLYTSITDITAADPVTQYVDKATVTAGAAMDMDPAHFVVVDSMVEGDVCDILGKPVALTFRYIPGDTVSSGQDSGKADILFNNGVDDDGTSFVIVTDETDPAKALSGDGKRFFEGNVAVGDAFVANEDVDDFGSNTVIHFFDDATGGLLQTVQYHTSCSQPIALGDVIGNATLVAYDGETGSDALPDPVMLPEIDLGGIMLSTDVPFDPNNIGEDADVPTGPLAELGDKVTWTYKVTNTGNVPLTITSLFDDNETLPFPPGTGDDDFAPAPVLVGGFNVGDANQNGLLDPGEMWFYQAMEIATEPGQHKNTAKVIGEDDASTMVMDDDMSHYIVNPLDIEKLVRVAAPTMSGDVCDALGKPVAMTFRYIPGNSVSTGQDSGKAAILSDNGEDGDGLSFVIVTDETDAAKALSGDGKQFFQGNVAFNELFEANEDVDDFGSNTVIHFFDDAGGGLLQTVQYHTSCSQPIRLGDVIGNATLVGYVGETDSGSVDDLGPGLSDADADVPTGPSARTGDTVVFTYVVTNTGATPLAGAIANVVVTDQVLVPAVGPVFNPDPVEDGGFNIGDVNQDDRLDLDEVWLYTSTMDIDDATPIGQHMDKATVVGNPVANGVVQTEELMDMDPAHFEVVETPAFVGDVCDVFGKPIAMTFRYIPGNFVNTDQDSGKADILFNGAVDDDGTSFVIVTDETDAAKALNGDGKRFFEGDVAFDATFVANEDVDDFGSNTVIHFFDDSDGPVLQTVQYHTSCSQTIQLGDVIGNATLVDYLGEDGAP